MANNIHCITLSTNKTSGWHLLPHKIIQVGSGRNKPTKFTTTPATDMAPAAHCENCNCSDNMVTVLPSNLSSSSQKDISVTCHLNPLYLCFILCHHKVEKHPISMSCQSSMIYGNVLTLHRYPTHKGPGPKWNVTMMVDFLLMLIILVYFIMSWKSLVLWQSIKACYSWISQILFETLQFCRRKCRRNSNVVWMQ